MTEDHPTQSGLTAEILPSGRKLVLVTGGNRGIGKGICEQLLIQHPDIHVILGSRDLEKGKEAAKKMVARNVAFCSRITVVQLDVASDVSVRSAAKTVSGLGLGKLYGIVNNAAVSPCTSSSCKEIIETNYFGPRRVNDAFSSVLSQPGGRIVNVSSVGAPTYLSGCLFLFGLSGVRAKVHEKLGNPKDVNGTLELDKVAHCDVLGLCKWTLGTFLGAPLLFPTYHAYQLSKALLNAYTVLHSSKEPNLTVNGCCPGFIDTDLVPKRFGFSGTLEQGSKLPIALLMGGKYRPDNDGKFFIEGMERGLSEIPDIKECPDSFRVILNKFLPLQKQGKNAKPMFVNVVWAGVLLAFALSLLSLTTFLG